MSEFKSCLEAVNESGFLIQPDGEEKFIPVLTRQQYNTIRRALLIADRVEKPIMLAIKAMNNAAWGHPDYAKGYETEALIELTNILAEIREQK